MARITVEDCVDKVANRFDLVLLAAHRARTIAKGAAITASDVEGDATTGGSAGRRPPASGRALRRRPPAAAPP